MAVAAGSGMSGTQGTEQVTVRAGAAWIVAAGVTHCLALVLLRVAAVTSCSRSASSHCSLVALIRQLSASARFAAAEDAG